MTNTEYPFADDSIGSVYAEEKAMERTVLQAAKDCREAGLAAITKKNAYTKLKESALVNMFAEEAAWDKKPRTIDQRTAMYRTAYAVEREAWMMADREYEIAKTYLEACQAVLNSIQTRSRLIQIDSKLS